MSNLVKTLKMHVIFFCETSVLTKIWIPSNSFFSHRVSLKAKVLISSSYCIQTVNMPQVFLVSLVLP